MKSIEVVIGGRKYPVKVAEDEETAVLGAIEDIEQKLREFQQTYRGKDKQDYLSMALLTYALESAKTQAGSAVSAELLEKTDSIVAALEAVSL